MAKFRKRPVVIEAEQFDGSLHSANKLVMANIGHVHPELLGEDLRWTGRLEVKSREGVIYADPGDWIIIGIAGERYPCKPEIFAATYDAVEEST